MPTPLKTDFNTTITQCPLFANNENMGWDQADQYLLNYLAEKKPPLQTLSIIEDRYGALSQQLIKFRPRIFTDSATNRTWIEKNINHQLKVDTIDQLSLHQCETYLLKLPKNLDYFRLIIASINIEKGCFFISGMQKYWSSGFFQAVYDKFSDITVLPAVKKAKIIICRNKKLRPKTPVKQSYCYKGIECINLANVFSAKKIDMGTRFMLDNLPTISHFSKGLDLGCGNGVLGTFALKNGVKKMIFLDDSHQAILSTQATIIANNIDQHRIRLIHANNLMLIKDSIDFILCNPPFHTQHQISINIAINMFHESQKTLKHGGVIYVIFNRHLPYMKPLKQLFASVHLIAENHKFRLVVARKE